MVNISTGPDNSARSLSGSLNDISFVVESLEGIDDSFASLFLPFLPGSLNAIGLAFIEPDLALNSIENGLIVVACILHAIFFEIVGVDCYFATCSHLTFDIRCDNFYLNNCSYFLKFIIHIILLLRLPLLL